MKAYKTIYKHGHFIDLESGKRLIPIQNYEYTITADDNAFNEVDNKLVIKDPQNSLEQEAHIISKHGVENCVNILEKGTQLFFRIGNSRSIEGDESRQYIFTCTLLEDLYLFKIKGKSGEENKHWRLESCVCELDACLLGDLTISERVRGNSLSNLFDKTVQFYFSNQRSASLNAITNFYMYNPDMDIDFYSAANQMYHSIDSKRAEIVNELNGNLIDR
ncbi:hypothetical protein [Lutibacter sp.]|uniref:hypothetical protein n=1 Tax=Lutibacter sp. TaxID=1925666 RepID=UPI00356551D9